MTYNDRMENEAKINRIMNRMTNLCSDCKHSESKHTEQGCLASVLSKVCGCPKFASVNSGDDMNGRQI